MEAMTTSHTATVTLPTDEQILITREFNAPRHLVYEAFTTPELVQRWWTAKRGEMKVCEIDLRPGGKWRYVMETPDGIEVGFHGEYREIVPNERIVSTEIFEGMPEGLPEEESVNTATFTEDGRPDDAHDPCAAQHKGVPRRPHQLRHGGRPPGRHGPPGRDRGHTSPRLVLPRCWVLEQDPAPTVDRGTPEHDSWPTPPRRHRLPPPRPDGARLDRGRDRDHRAGLVRSRASTTPTTTRRTRSRRPRATSPRSASTGTPARRSTPSGRTRPARRAPPPSSASTTSSPRRSRSSTWPSTRRSGTRDDGTIGSTTLPLTVPGWEVEKEQGEELVAAAEGNSGDGLEIELGGDPIYRAQEPSSPEGLGFLGAAIVLLIAFGSVVAAGLPLLIALVGLGITSGGLILLLANVVDVPDWTTAVSGLIGIGVGIDYSLLVLTRFRAAMNEGKDRHDAVVEAVTTAGRSVVIAGGTVLVAIFGLILTGLPYMYGVAISRLARGPGRGARLDHPAAGAAVVPRAEGRPPADPVPRPHAEDGGERRVARRALEPMVQRRPWPLAIVATLLLLALAAPALGMRLGFPDAGNDPPDTMTRQAYDLNTEGFGPGTNGPLVIAADLPGPRTRRASRGLRRRRSARSRRGVRPRPTINDEGNAAIVTVIPKSSPQDEETRDLGPPPARRRHPRGARRHGHKGRGRRRDRRARGPERLHHGPHAGCSSSASSACRSCCCCWRSTRH